MSIPYNLHKECDRTVAEGVIVASANGIYRKESRTYVMEWRSRALTDASVPQPNFPSPIILKRQKVIRFSLLRQQHDRRSNSTPLEARQSREKSIVSIPELYSEEI